MVTHVDDAAVLKSFAKDGRLHHLVVRVRVHPQVSAALQREAYGPLEHAAYASVARDLMKRAVRKLNPMERKVLYTWTEGGCSDGEEYYQYYYYANGFLVGTEVNSKKKSYVFVIENTPWDPSLMA